MSTSEAIADIQDYQSLRFALGNGGKYCCIYAAKVLLIDSVSPNN